MKNYSIDVDEIIWNYLCEHAKPFSDTPNAVLHRLLFNTSSYSSFGTSSSSNTEFKIDRPNSSINVSRALAQTLEVIYEVIKMKRSRPEATKITAERHHTTTQTILDKYCRQLGLKAHEFDGLLQDPEMTDIRQILIEKYPKQKEHILTFFESLPVQSIPNYHSQQSPRTASESRGLIVGDRRTFATTVRRIASGRKQRDTELEKLLKLSVGDSLKETWGVFTLKDSSLLVFRNKRVLCKYSSINDDQAKWFWGVSKKYWNEWEQTDYLALILENKGENSYSYIMLDSDEAHYLFGRCSESNGEKKISMRIYADDSKPHLQDWQDFDVENRLIELNTDWL